MLYKCGVCAANGLPDLASKVSVLLCTEGAGCPTSDLVKVSTDVFAFVCDQRLLQ